MSDYSCCVRVEKRCTPISLIGTSNHNRREKKPQHADSERAKDNLILKGGDTPLDQLVFDRLEQLKIRPRKNAVLAVEIVLVVGEPFFQKVNQSEYMEKALVLLEQIFGVENVVSFIAHGDEAVPHPHALVVPITPDGRLSCKAVFEQDRKLEPPGPNGERCGNPAAPFFRRLQQRHYEMCHLMDPEVRPPVPGGSADHVETDRWRAQQKLADLDLRRLPEPQVQPPTVVEWLSPQRYAEMEVEADRKRCQPVCDVTQLFQAT